MRGLSARGLRRAAAAAAVAAAGWAAHAPASPATAAPGWDMVRTPAPGPARVFGYYTNGCIAGARRLPLAGPGFRVLRPQRNRFWGHPQMLAFIRALGAWTQGTFGRALLVADIAQPRGGPISGHASHEIGLDADIRLLLLKPEEIGQGYLVKPPQISMVVPKAGEIDRNRWSSRQVRLIRKAARDPRVDRLFVHPVIKRELCRSVRANRGWLAKVVPWWGHDAHMHIRLHCPKGSPDCRAQTAVPSDDGCGKPLAWWFEVALPAARKWREKQKRLKPKKPETPKRRAAPPPLPKACDAVLAGE